LHGDPCGEEGEAPDRSWRPHVSQGLVDEANEPKYVRLEVEMTERKPIAYLRLDLEWDVVAHDRRVRDRSR
jgi:hypothetical protein